MHTLSTQMGLGQLEVAIIAIELAIVLAIHLPRMLLPFQLDAASKLAFAFRCIRHAFATRSPERHEVECQ